MQLHDIRFLKRLAAATAATEAVTANSQWKRAYRDLHSGAALLWRLVEKSQVDGREKFGSDDTKTPAA